MKKWPTLALTAGLVAVGLTTTEATAALPDPAPSNVKISWKDETYKFVHVTWDEAGARPNKIYVRAVDRPQQYRVHYVAADQSNEVDLPTEELAVFNYDTQIGVAVGTETGETSPAALSVPFDTSGPPPVVLDSATLSGTSTLHVKWHTGKPSTDNTPDPLDRPYQGLTRPGWFTGGKSYLLGEFGTTTEYTFTGPTPPYGFAVDTQNEWSVSWGSLTISALPSDLKATIPSRGVFGRPLVISGTFRVSNETKRLVVLQARNTPADPWYVVSSGLFPDSKFQFTVTNQGTRQYRVALPNGRVEMTAWFGGYSGPVTTTIQQQVAGSFDNPIIARGQSSRTRLTVQPAIDTTAILQRWNGTTWTTVGPVPVKGGLGVGYIRGAAAGRVAYRYYVPANTWRGLPVAAAYTPNFVLTTR